MRLAIAAALCAALSACEVTTETGARYISHHDDGGWIPDYVAAIERINAQGKTVVLDGYCASACTMYLGADSVCIADRDVHFEFHGAWPIITGTKAEWDAVMASYYAPPLRAWYYTKAYKLQGLGLRLDAAEVSRLTGVPFC